MATVTERHDVVVIGAGQAGLAASYELTSRGVDHVVLERSEIGHAWSTRWDSFCLVTPNWSIRLPGGPYDGPDPDGYLARDEIVAHLERYAASFDAPVRTGVDVRRVQPSDDGFSVATGDGVLPARSVIVATGTYARPHLPPGADSLPASIARLAIVDYGNPGSVPDGSILVIGSGQSGCQIAEELLEAGRDVVLACGRAPWVHRRFSGHDMAWWSDRDGFLDMPVDALPSNEARLFSNVQASGRDGGHDLTTRTLHASGARLTGHLVGVGEGRAWFAQDLAESVAWGDARHREFMALCERFAEREGIDYEPPPPPEPFDEVGPESESLDGFGAVVFAGGFRPNYAEWIEVSDAFDELGFPAHRDGQSTSAPGLFFLGTHFLRTRRSSLLMGVGDDAAIVADLVRSRLDGAAAAT
jgi:putative flavoprotein involved in K+ transport